MALLHLSQTTALSKVVVYGLRATALILESLEAQATASKEDIQVCKGVQAFKRYQMYLQM